MYIQCSVILLGIYIDGIIETAKMFDELVTEAFLDGQRIKKCSSDLVPLGVDLDFTGLPKLPRRRI